MRSKILTKIKELRYNYFPLRSWWKVRKWYKMPKIHFYIGRMEKKKKCEKEEESFPVELGYFYFMSQDYLKWSNILGITFDSYDVGWKWKYHQIRYESNPFASIIFGTNIKYAFQIAIWFTAPKVKAIYNRNASKGNMRYATVHDDDYWETLLKTLHKYNEDFEKMCEEKAFDHWIGYSEGKVRVSSVLNPNFLTNKGCRILSEVLLKNRLDEFQVKEQESYDKYLESKKNK